MSPPNRQIMHWFYNRFNFHTSGSINLQGAILFGKWKRRFFRCRTLIRNVSMMRESEHGHGGILQPLMYRLRSSRLLFLYFGFLWGANSPTFRFTLETFFGQLTKFSTKPTRILHLVGYFHQKSFYGMKKKRLYWRHIYTKYDSFGTLDGFSIAKGSS